MDAFKSLFSKLKTKIKTYPKSAIALCLLAIFSVLFFCMSIGRFVDMIRYECQQIANCDSFLYFTVGKGLANGLKPYAEVYENKPPLVFILSAISYKLLGNYLLVNVFSALSILAIFVIPVVIAIIIVRRKHTPVVLATTIVIFTATASLLFASFSQQNGAEVQTETLGTGLMMVAMLFLTFINEKTKAYSPSVIFFGVFVGLATMMKEPFIIIAFSVVVLFCNNLKDYLKKLIIPFCIAGIVCFLTLLVGNCVDTYFTIYLKNMLFSHISIYGSPFERMLNVTTLFDFSFAFSSALPPILLFGLIFSVCQQLSIHYSDTLSTNVILKFLNGLKPIICLYLASFCVGLGGQYFYHHYVFAVATFIAYLVNGIEFIAVFETFEKQKPLNNSIDESTNENSSKKKLSSMLIIKKSTAFVVIGLLLTFNLTALPKLPQNDEIHSIMENEFIMAKAHAKYVDDFLDAIGADTYQWVGFNGPYPYALTKHFPNAPLFVQDPANFSDPDSFFSKKFLEQLQNADVLIFQFDTINLGSITEQVIEYINANFVPDMPPSMYEVFSERPISFYYSVYFRKGKFQ